MKNKIYLFGIAMMLIMVAFKPVTNKKVIAIDASHGGSDAGASFGNAMEKNIVNDISKKIKALNKNEELEIVLIREGDVFMDIKDRVSKINSIKPNLLIVLHLNNDNDQSVTGVDAYASKDNMYFDSSMEDAKELIAKIGSSNLQKGQVKERNIFVLKNAKCPAVSIDLGNLSNENDKKYIVSEEGQNEIAQGVLNFLNN